MTGASRWIVAAIATIAIVAVVLFARGSKERGVPVESPPAVVIESII